MLGQTCWSGRSSVADLSPAAQAVLDALLNAPVNSGQVCNGKAPQIKLAAALRAAADQVVGDEPDYMRDAVPSTDWWDKHDQVRSELLSLAAELDPTP
jgi:hypothetical protein